MLKKADREQQAIVRAIEIETAIELEVEELEDRIAPGIDKNHNQTMLQDELKIEELEGRIAPGLSQNHNETMLSDTK